MNIAFVGCGHVADFYMHTRGLHEDLRLVGVYDRHAERSAAFAGFYRTKAFSTLESLLGDPSIELVLDLTNPRSHHQINKLCLEAGKHVYSEKPLAMRFEEASELVEIAKDRGLRLGGAPASLLGESAQTLAKALRDGMIGRPRLVYANIDAGMIHKSEPWKHKSVSGAPWPAKDEFEVGCTFEHAGYVLTWLAMFFGSAKAVTSFSACLLPDKGIAVDRMAPDFSVGLIEYENGVVARLTNGVVAPLDHSVTIIGDDGLLYTRDVWDIGSPVILRRGRVPLPKRIYQATLNRAILWTPGMTGLARYDRRLKPVRKVTLRPQGSIRMDFLRGPAEMADAIDERRACRISPQLVLHVTELTAVLQHPDPVSARYVPRSAVGPIEPMPWAR